MICVDNSNGGIIKRLTEPHKKFSYASAKQNRIHTFFPLCLDNTVNFAYVIVVVFHVRARVCVVVQQLCNVHALAFDMCHMWNRVKFVLTMRSSSVIAIRIAGTPLK